MEETKEKGKQGSHVPRNDKHKRPREKEKGLLRLDYCHALFVKNQQKLTAPLVVV